MQRDESGSGAEPEQEALLACRLLSGSKAGRSMTQDRVIRSAAVVAVCTALSRALGLLRLILMAAFFGTSLAQSAFVIAFRIPNLFRRLFGEGALSAAFIPVFTESLEKEGRERAWRLASTVITLLGSVLAGVVVIVLLVTSASIRFLPLGEKAAMVLPLLRVMFPYMFFICMVALCMAILNSFRHFLVPAATPIVLNVVWILALVLLCPRFGDTPERRIFGVAWGILAGGMIQLGVQFPVLARYGYRPRLSFIWRDPRVLRTLGLLGPAAFGMGVVQINVLIDSLLALAVGKWAPAALNFAELMVYMPLGIIATALGTVLLPTFSHQAAQSRPDEIKRTLNRALRVLLFVMAPAAVGLMVLARPIIQLLFEWRGWEFDSISTTRTARALIFYAPGLVVFGLYKVLVPVFYAFQDTLRPVRVALWVVALNFLLNVTFVLTWPAEYKHAGLAFATVVASTVNVFVLARLLHMKIGSPDWAGVLKCAARVAFGSLLMGAAVMVTYKYLGAAVLSMPCHPKGGEVLAVTGSILTGLVVYLGFGFVLCRDEVRAVSGLRR